MHIIFIDRGVPHRELLGAELTGEDTVHCIADEQFLLEAPEAARQADVIVVGPNQSIASILSLSVQLHKIDGIWFEVTLSAAPGEVDVIAGGGPDLYGRRGVVAVAKRQLSRRELARRGLANG